MHILEKLFVRVLKHSWVYKGEGHREGRSPSSWPQALAENSPEILMQFIPWMQIIKGREAEV